MISILSMFWLAQTIASIIAAVLLEHPSLGLEFIPHLFSYGKIRDLRRFNLQTRYLFVPKSWFYHFYAIGVLVVTPLLIFSLVTVCYNGKMPAEIEWLIEWLRFPSIYESLWLLMFTTILQCLFDELISSKGHGSPVSTLIVLFLINLHMFRRLIECLFVSIFSESQMSIIIYMVGLLFYTIMPLSYVVGTDFTSIDGCTGFLGKIEWNHVVGLLLFLWSSWKQMKAAQIFANLRLTKKGAADRQHHIPVGDFFQYISCPHFFFEILIYTSVNVIYWWSCTLAIFVLLFVAANQITMGHFSHKWYKDTFRFYPDNRKAIIPFVY